MGGSGCAVMPPDTVSGENGREGLFDDKAIVSPLSECKRKKTVGNLS